MYGYAKARKGAVRTRFERSLFLGYNSCRFLTSLCQIHWSSWQNLGFVFWSNLAMEKNCCCLKWGFWIERSLIEILRERDKVLEGMKHDRDKLRKHKFDRLDTSLIKITAKDVRSGGPFIYSRTSQLHGSCNPQNIPVIGIIILIHTRWCPSSVAKLVYNQHKKTQL